MKYFAMFGSGVENANTCFTCIEIDQIVRCFRDNYDALKYGGSNQGLMHLFANHFFEEGGYVMGIYPKWLKQYGYVADFNESVVVENLAQRKKELLKGISAILCLPGGIGTLDEVITYLAELSVEERADQLPVVFYDVQGYYRPLEVLFETMGVFGAIDLRKYKMLFSDDVYQISDFIKG